MFEDEKTTRTFFVCATIAAAVLVACIAAVNIHRNAVNPGGDAIDGTYEIVVRRK